MAEHFSCSAIILAAGKGTRMKSRLPKVMQPILEEPMLYYILQSLKKAGITEIITVIGHKGELVRDWLAKNAPDVRVAWQKEQLGTGHAVMSAAAWLKDKGRVIIINGDMPMITAEEISSFVEHASSSDAAFMTCELPDAGNYGRVVRSGNSVAIVEAKDATPDQKLIKEINAGVYLFNAPQLLEGLSSLTQNNSQREYYIVDLISWACSNGLSVLVDKFSADDLGGVNNPLELAELSLKMRNRILAQLLLDGVKCVDPASVWISPRVVFHGESIIYPNVQIWGNSSIGDGCEIGSGSILRSVVLKNNVKCTAYVVAQDIVAEDNVTMGPFCFLRDGTHLRDGAFAGKFVEIKNSDIGEGTKVPHLSYMGDATIGPDTNIGAASVTCNYDGINKNPTHIGAHCFVGSDTMLVAPITVGDGVTVAAGSVLTQDVPENSLAIARSRQVVIKGWERNKKSDKINNMEAK